MLWIILGTCLTAGSNGCYLAGVIKGEILPHPFSWGIWALLSVIGWSVAFVSGMGWAILPLTMLSAVTVIIFGFSLRIRGTYEKISAAMPILAFIAIVGWLASGIALIAAACIVLADGIGAAPTLTKTWQAPNSEPAWIWACDSAGLGCGLIAMHTHALAAFLYPGYLIVLCGSMAIIASRSYFNSAS